MTVVKGCGCGSGAGDDDDVTEAVCGSDAEFDDESDLDCFTLFSAGQGQPVEEEIPGSFLDALTVSDGLLTVDFNTTASSTDDGGFPFLAKEVAADEDLEVEILISGGLPSSATERIGLGIMGQEARFLVYYSFFNGFNSVTCQSAVGDALTAEDEVGTLDPPLFLRIERTGSTYTCSFRRSESENNTDLLSETREGANDGLDPSLSTILIGIFGKTGNTAGTFAPQIDYWRYLVGGAPDQD